MALALKTTSYGIVHVAVATTIAYLLTGNLAVAVGIGLIEPIAQTGVFAVHEIIWRRIERRKPAAAVRTVQPQMTTA